MYKFYIFNEGNPPSGPYSATEIKEMELEKGTLVFELTINDGEPTPIEEIDIEYFSREELDEQDIYTAPDNINEQLLQQPNGEIPSIIGKWNWGAFVFPALWGLANGIYWPAIISAIASIAERLTRSNENLVIVHYSIFAILLIIRIILGVNGNKMAWKSERKHLSIEKFEREQKFWKIIGLASLATIAIVALGLWIYHTTK
ncbi:MAG: hypothetical protein IK025_04530 [Bacteroidales bacterium]|nr:hypothetical protein [Bacteroidales bacterium]